VVATNQENTAGERHAVLNQDGSLVEGRQPRLSGEQAQEGLRWMLLSRAFDERATALQRQGQLGVYSPVLGQEAAVVGSSLALDPAQDWIAPAYRELPAVVRHGYPLERLAASYMGKVMSGRIPDDVKVLPSQVALATQLQHATGLAWGLRLQGKEGIVITYFGEGASSEGDFHEACNLAGVVRAPVVFFLQNNNWAISTPRKIQSGAASLAARAAGYGFPGVTVDGNDMAAVYEVTADAVARARSGEGPTLIEALTYRLSFHNTTDNPSRYVEPGELEAARRRDPISRVEAYLRAGGHLDDATRDQLHAEAAQVVDDAIQAAQAFPGPEPGQVFENVYEKLPARVEAQRRQALGLG
jgi:pyruvate dehydrogenase E1 component alpha subunit